MEVEEGAEGAGDGDGRFDGRLEEGEAKREGSAERALVGGATDEGAAGAGEGRGEDDGSSEAVRDVVGRGFGLAEAVGAGERRGVGIGIKPLVSALIFGTSSDATFLLFLTRSNLALPLCTISTPSAPPRLLAHPQLSHLAQSEPASTQKAAFSPPTSSDRHAEHFVSSAAGARGFWEESEWAAEAER